MAHRRVAVIVTSPSGRSTISTPTYRNLGFRYADGLLTSGFGSVGAEHWSVAPDPLAGNGFTHSVGKGFMPPSWVPRQLQEGEEAVTVYGAGWPWTCVYRVETATRRPFRPGAGSPRIGADVWTGHLDAPSRITGVDARLPVLPVPLGLALDAVVWGAAVFVAAFGWSGVRGLVRRFRQLCPGCGYDARGLRVCPECGRARHVSDGEGLGPAVDGHSFPADQGRGR
ncbi:MAG: hypothetical protein ACREJO_14705 [Phycisphaerales bacterium]